MSGRISRASLVALLLLVAAVPLLVGADDSKVLFPAGTESSSGPTAPAAGGMNLLTVVAAFVIAALGAWLVWRNRRTTGGRRESRALSIAETRSLGNRQYLVVASYEGKKFLLGVCPGRIDLLSPLGERRPGGDLP